MHSNHGWTKEKKLPISLTSLTLQQDIFVSMAQNQLSHSIVKFCSSNNREKIFSCIRMNKYMKNKPTKCIAHKTQDREEKRFQQYKGSDAC